MTADDHAILRRGLIELLTREFKNAACGGSSLATRLGQRLGIVRELAFGIPPTWV